MKRIRSDNKGVAVVYENILVLRLRTGGGK